MVTQSDYHGWDIPTVEEDEDKWGDYLVNTMHDGPPPEEEWVNDLSIDDEVILKNTRSNRPDSAVAGRWFLATDEHTLYYDTGDGWDVIVGQRMPDVQIRVDGIRADIGSPAEPSYTFVTDTNTGFFRATGGVVGTAGNSVLGVMFGPGWGQYRDAKELRFGSDSHFAFWFDGLGENPNNELVLTEDPTGASSNVLRIPVGEDIILEDRGVNMGTNTLHDDDTVIWDAENQQVPLSSLEESTVTLEGGNGLKNGSTIALGETFALDIEPADFAGTFLSDDGTDNLTVDIGTGLVDDGSEVIELDTDVSPTWTSTHTFDAGLDTNNDLTHGAVVIFDTTNDHVPEAQVDISGHADTSDAHHTKTTSSDISHDSTDGGTRSDAHHSKYALSDDINASGVVTLSSGSAIVSTGVTTAGTHVDVLLDPSGDGANATDVKVAARAFWDNAAGEYKVEILEDGTEVGNPDVGYEVVTN